MPLRADTERGRRERRAAACLALALAAGTLALAAMVALSGFPRGLIGLALVVAASVAALGGLERSGRRRRATLVVAVVLAVAAVPFLFGPHVVLAAIAVAALVTSVITAAAAFRVHVVLPAAPRPAHPVLFHNPRAGDGKAVQHDLPGEARARGIEPVELAPDADLEQLVRAAVARGVDALAMAGGDGSQSIVAAVASEHSLPYACIPAGTRNHFALDLGVDRDDVVGALDALVDGGERVVDLAEVNGRVFVNNVSLGAYAEAVGKPGYRDAKLRTLLDAIPDAIAPAEGDATLQFDGPDGARYEVAGAILVSNDRYRLEAMLGAGTRPRLDEGVLGITAGARPSGADDASPARLDWSAVSFTVDATGRVPAAIDGEATTLDAPLEFRTRPAALRVRIARAHPGASPSAFEPEGFRASVYALVALALGRPG